MFRVQLAVRAPVMVPVGVCTRVTGKATVGGRSLGQGLNVVLTVRVRPRVSATDNASLEASDLYCA